METFGNPAEQPNNRLAGIKDRIYTVVGAAQVIFHWGFLPAVIYLGNNDHL